MNNILVFLQEIQENYFYRKNNKITFYLTLYWNMKNRQNRQRKAEYYFFLFPHHLAPGLELL
jgi:hypothetical protein